MEKNSSRASSERANGGRPDVFAGIWVRLFIGAILAVGVRVVIYDIDARSLPPLDLTTVVAFVAGLLYGRWGLAGAVIAAMGYLGIRQGAVPDLRLALAELFVGLVAFELFRRLPRVGRGLPNLGSWGALLLAAVIGSLGAALLQVSMMSASLPWSAVAFWWSTGITTIMLVAPPVVLILLAIPFTSRARAPIPGEVSAGFLRWLRGAGDRSAWQRAVAVGGPWLLALALSFLEIDGPRSGSFYWVALLYAVPVLWAANELGLRGGVLVASLVGFSQLLRQPFEVEHAADVHETWMSLQAGALVFAILGALWGGARQREATLRDQLSDANARLRRDLKRTIRALQSAIAAKDDYTEGHLRRVSAYAIDVGRSLGVAGRDLELLELASLLHDVGKIGIPEDILRKPDVLDEEELRQMQEHPEIGARILEDVEGLAEAAPLVRFHQERWDGERVGDFPGYPSGLKAEKIPLGARIIAVVDAFDAMTSDRPYRPARPIEEAIGELQRESGRQFDPYVVEAFLELLDRRPWKGEQTARGRVGSP